MAAPSKRLERRPSGIGLPRYVACDGLRSHRLVEADNAGYKKAPNHALERPVNVAELRVMDLAV
jgi:hypothetical protein